MQYKSPFHIISSETAFHQIKFERKKILAQFEINDNQPIVVNGKEYTKSETLKILEELETEAKFNFHKLIFETPALLIFLEEGQITEDLLSTEMSFFSEQEGFTSFISPYFAAQYALIILKAFHSEDYQTIIQLSKIPFLCADEYYAVCFNKTLYEFTSLCNALKKEVRQVKKNQNPYLIRREYFERDSLIDTINALPDYFASQRDEYVKLLLQAVAECYNLKNRGFAMHLIVQAKRLKCSAEVREIVDNYYGQIKRQDAERLAEIERKGDNSSNKGCIWVMVALAIGFGVPLILISVLTKKNEIPKEYKKIFYLDTLITAAYPVVPDSPYCYHINAYYPYVMDSINRAEDEKKQKNDIYQLINLNSKEQRSFNKYYNESAFITSEYSFKNYKTYIKTINNTTYDATLFIVKNDNVLHDIHLYRNDTVYTLLYEASYNLDVEYALWLYIGEELNRVYQFTINNMKLGHGYKRQPLNYRGIYNTNETFKFSIESTVEDTLRIRKHNNFIFQLEEQDDTIILIKEPFIQYDTMVVHY